MNFITFLRLIARNLRWLLLTGATVAFVVFNSTKNTPKTYESYTTLNTGLVSGYSIESNNGKRIDFGYTNYEMENIMSIAKSREIQEEVAARLLAQALMLTKPSLQVLSEPNFSALKKDIPQSTRDSVVDYMSFERTLENVRTWRDSLNPNPVKNIFLGNHPLFSIEHIKGMVIKREDKNSDAIRVTYSANDPGVCRNTLYTLIEVFQSKYKNIKEGQSSDVVNFFENATQESSSILNGREDNMLSFMEQNKIINYYEQTRFIAAKKEDLDEMYFKEVMQLAAADSARRHLEEQLNKYVNIPDINKQILKHRNQLSTISTNLANIEISSLDENPEVVDNKDVVALKKQTERIKKELKNQADATYATVYTPEGIEIKNILSQWLNQIINVEQSLARLNVFKNRKVEFDRLYGKFAPWGSSIKKLERSIDIAEKAYLENLHSYNQARLHRYNTMMTANLSIIDKPLYPEKPNPSNRMMLVVMGFLVGFILPLAVILALFLLDKSLRTPDRVPEMTNLEVFAAFPKLPRKWLTHSKIDYMTTMRRATNQLVQNVNIVLHERGKAKNDPVNIAVVSTLGGEGKSMIIERLNDYYKENNYQNITFNELPPLLTEDYSCEMLNNPDIILLVCHADFTWKNADKKAVLAVSRYTKLPCYLILNNVSVDYLESSLGEIPKQRSRLRRILKQVISMNLTKSSKKRKIKES